MTELTTQLDDFIRDCYPAVLDLGAALSSVCVLREEKAGSQPDRIAALAERWRACVAALAPWEPLGLGIDTFALCVEPIPSTTALTESAWQAFLSIDPTPGTLIAEARQALAAEGFPP